MKILIVDDEPSVVEALQATVHLGGAHEVFLATNGEDAFAIATQAGGVDLLISDVVMSPLDGFALRQRMLEAFPNMQTVFITGYDISDHEASGPGQKILKKPINPHEIIGSIRQAEETLSAWRQGMEPGGPRRPGSSPTERLIPKQGFTGQLDQFQLVDIIQMCCISRKSGRLRVSKGLDRGVIFLEDGNMVHAVCGDVEGAQAVYKIISWESGEFSLDEGVAPTNRTIQHGWEHLVMEGVRMRDEAGASAPQPETEGLIGKTLGSYRVLRKLGEGEWGDVYEAIQESVQRPVALKVLRQDLHMVPEAVQQFIADASAKANVQHPSILSVYEAGEENGVYFYSREYVEGHTLADLIAQGAVLDETTALQVVKTLGEAFLYLSHNKIPHSVLEVTSIFIGNDGMPRLANLASVRASASTPAQQDIRALGTIMASAMQGAANASPGVRALITRMQIEGNNGFLSWGALMQGVKALEPKVVPVDAYKLSEQDHAAIQAVEMEKKRQKRAALLSLSGILVLLILAAIVVWVKFIRVPKATDFSEMIHIPAGPFKYQVNAETVELPEFWIDKYEVSIGMYARFLEYLEANPTTEFDHPSQPPGKSHVPNGWAALYYAVTKGPQKFQGAPLTLDSPIFNIDWYDAYAYAKWMGRRLPTEQEWEKAARGTEGFRYPWGNTFDPKKVNSSADYNPDAKKGRIDGWNYWAPVNAVQEDRSPYGVIGMAGNVFEWTGSWDKNPRRPEEVLPVIRGGSFGSPDVDLTQRNIVFQPTQYDWQLGFRTASDAPPAKSK